MSVTNPVRLRVLREFLFKSIGRRSLLLILFALVFAGIGVQAAVNPVIRVDTYSMYQNLPLGLRAFVWIIPSVVALVVAFSAPRTRHDALGFAVLSAPTSFVFFSALFSWLAYLVGLSTYGGGWVSVLNYFLILCLLQVCAGWAEIPPEITQPVTLHTVDQRVVVLDSTDQDKTTDQEGLS